MAKVQLTSQLDAQLIGKPLSPGLLKQRFSDWKDGDEYSSYWFGRDSTDPQTKLSHVHLVPLNDQVALAEWDRFWRKPRECHRRRSDCYLMYACDAKHGHLLIALLADPGAHNLWKPSHRQLLTSFETVAENFIFAGAVP